jgi:hypothetical protein
VKRTMTLLHRALLASVLAVLTFSTTSFAYVLLGVTWDTEQGPIDFVIDEAGSDDISDGSDVEAVRLAFRAWACTPGSRLRVREPTDQVATRTDNLNDGVNSVFWDETGEFGLGPSTLGVNIGNGGGAQPRTASKIIFNGLDHTWSTGDSGGGVDVMSIALHESGHWIGLGHSCPDDQGNACPDGVRAVMSPAWSGALERQPEQDDKDGLLAMYPQDPADNSTCDGPFRKGEPCACSDECASGLTCVPQPDGSQVCASSCGSDAPTACGPGFNCVLGKAPADGEPAPGTCETVVNGTAKPPGAICQNDGFSCGAASCTQSGAAGGARVCFKGCLEDTDCDDGYICAGILCLKDSETLSLTCPDEEVDAGPGDDDDDDDDDGCGCDATGERDVAFSGLALVALVFVRARRR